MHFPEKFHQNVLVLTEAFINSFIDNAFLIDNAFVNEEEVYSKRSKISKGKNATGQEKI